MATEGSSVRDLQVADTRADTVACTIAAMHKQVGQRTVARSDPLRLASASWRTWLLHA